MRIFLSRKSTPTHFILERFSTKQVGTKVSLVKQKTHLTRSFPSLNEGSESSSKGLKVSDIAN